MMKNIFLLILFISVGYSQDTTFNEQQFFADLKVSYYSLESTEKKNFIAFFTNQSTEKFALKNWKNSEIFPVQLIWLSPEKLFISEQGYPALSDTSKEVFKEMVSDLKVQFQDILVNLKRFYFNGIYKSISDNYKIRTNEQLVEVSFLTVTAGDSVLNSYYFGKNGLCLKIISKSLSQNIQEETIPNFKIVKTRWLITGWKVQIVQDDKIEAGYLIELNNKFFDNVWVPSDIFITVQQSKLQGRTFQDVIKIRNYLFNQPLQFINQ